MKWKVLSSEYLTEHPPFFVSRRDVCQRPDGTEIPAYYVVELPPAVAVFAINDEEQVLMVKQYRHPIDQVSLELPGGFVDKGETHLDAAKRELWEETGCQFSDFTFIGKVGANPGVLNNLTHIFLATGFKKQEAQRLEKTEDIKTEFVPLNELVEQLREKHIIQAVHASACFYVLLHLGKINFQ